MMRHAILPSRMRDAIVSERLSGVTPEDAAGMYWEKCRARQSEIAERARVVWFDTHAAASGDLAGVEDLLRAAGLPVDYDAVDGFIERKFWHA